MNLDFLGYAAVVFVIARSLTAEEIFREPREWLKACYQDERRPKALRKLAYMPTCPFCSSFWITVVTIAVGNYRLVHDDWRGYIVAHAATMLTANIYMEIFNRIRIDNRKERAQADLTEQQRNQVSAMQNGEHQVSHSAADRLGDGHLVEGVQWEQSRP